VNAPRIRYRSRISCLNLTSLFALFVFLLYWYLLLRAKKVGHQISVSFEKFDVVQAILPIFF
jgi:hypothetical protein